MVHANMHLHVFSALMDRRARCVCGVVCAMQNTADLCASSDTAYTLMQATVALSAISDTYTTHTLHIHYTRTGHGRSERELRFRRQAASLLFLDLEKGPSRRLLCPRVKRRRRAGDRYEWRPPAAHRASGPQTLAASLPKGHGRFVCECARDQGRRLSRPGNRPTGHCRCANVRLPRAGSHARHRGQR